MNKLKKEFQQMLMSIIEVFTEENMLTRAMSNKDKYLKLLEYLPKKLNLFRLL